MAACVGRRRRLLPVFLFAGLLSAVLSQSALAAPRGAAFKPAPLFLDGQRLSEPLNTFTDQNTLMVPARPVLEALGFQIGWDREKSQVTFSRHGTRAAFRVGVAGVVVNGGFLPLPVAPVIQADRTYIPLPLLQVAGEKVYWDSAEQAVIARRPFLAPTAVVEEAGGSVTVFRSGGGPGRPAAVGDTLRPGDVIETGSGSSVHVGLDDGSLVEMAPGSRLEVGRLAAGSGDASRKVSFKLLLGRVFVRVSKLIHKNSSFELETPTGVVGVRGTMFLVEVDPSGRSVAAVVSGKVAVSSGSGEGRQAVLLEDRQETVIAAAGAPPEPPHLLKDITVDTWVEKAVEKAILRHAEDTLAPEVPTLGEDKVKEKAADKLDEARKALERAKLRQEKGEEAVPEPAANDDKRPEPKQPKPQDEHDSKPKAEQPKAEQPQPDQPKVEQPEAEQPQPDQPKVEQPIEEYDPWPEEVPGKEGERKEGERKEGGKKEDKKRNND